MSNTRNLGHRAVKKARISERNRDMGAKNRNPHFIKTDELWSTYFDTFGKPSGRATKCQKFVGQSAKPRRYSDKCRKLGLSLWGTIYRTRAKSSKSKP